MPIRPENKARYPKNWPHIREAKLQIAGNRCQWPGCGAINHSVGYWRETDKSYKWGPLQGNAQCDLAGQGLAWPSLLPLTYSEARAFAADLDGGDMCEGQKATVIVLTIAHLDHTPENCADDNLRAWCQRHHLAYDAEHHKATAYATRRAARRTPDMFEEAA